MNMQLAQAIDAIDLGPISRTMQVKRGWPAAKVQCVEAQYRAFLNLCMEEPGLAVPSADLDAYWETHILDTRKYASDCKAAFGTFLHHVPDALERVQGLTRPCLLARFQQTMERIEAASGLSMKGVLMSGCDDCIPDYDPPSDPDPQIGMIAAT